MGVGTVGRDKGLGTGTTDEYGTGTAAGVAVDPDPPLTKLLEPVPKECGDP